MSKTSVSSTLEAVALELIQTTVAQFEGRSTTTVPEVTSAVVCNVPQVSSSVNQNLPQIASIVNQNVPKVVSVVAQSELEVSSAVVPNISGSSHEIQSTSVKIPKKGKIVDSPSDDVAMPTFNDLLRVKTDDQMLMKDLYRP